jgi:hypothetical protein
MPRESRGAERTLRRRENPEVPKASSERIRVERCEKQESRRESRGAERTLRRRENPEVPKASSERIRVERCENQESPRDARGAGRIQRCRENVILVDVVHDNLVRGT